MASTLTKNINSNYTPTFMSGYPIYAYGGIPHQYGFGSFLKKNWTAAVSPAIGLGSLISGKNANTFAKENAGIIGTGVGAAAGTLVGNPMLGAQIGGQIGGQVQGNYEQGLQQEQQNNVMLEQQKRGLVANLPAQHNYTPTFADGGKLKDKSKVITNKDYIKAWDKYRDLQGEYTQALAKKYPNIPIDSILGSYVADSTFTNRNVSNYANDLINKYGDFNLAPTEMDSIAGVTGTDIRDLERVLTGYDKENFQDSINTVGNKEDYTSRFGPRMMLQKRYAEGQVPYKFLEENSVLNSYAGGGAMNFKSGAAYKKWLGYVHAKGLAESTPGHQKVSIKGQPHKVQHAMGGDADMLVQKNGGQINDRLNEIKSGSTHEQSPYNGVPVTNDALLEDKEFLYTTKDGKKYVFSNRF